VAKYFFVVASMVETATPDSAVYAASADVLKFGIAAIEHWSDGSVILGNVMRI
jgi:hypothetical protein